MSGSPPVGDPGAHVTPSAPSAPSALPQILVPDACMGVKWFVPETDAADARRLLAPRFSLHVPTSFFTESASVLQRKVAVDGTLSEADGLAAFQLLRTVPVTVHPTTPLLEAASRIGVRYRRPVYDSLYLVLASSLGGRVVTADKRLYHGAHGGPLDFLVLWVTDPL
ncbi:MAG: type II toxin-antitoxin system VapC family toxin [Planctomycetaceae bacterium]|nr:type II toxin-antitoxin system VapC family toxin [Planctomycetaceae bacterium]